MLHLPIGAQLWVLREELPDGGVELGWDGLELVDYDLDLVPRHEVGVGCGERAGVLLQRVAGLLLDLLELLTGLVRIEQILGAEAGDGAGVNPVGRLGLSLSTRVVKG